VNITTHVLHISIWITFISFCQTKHLWCPSFLLVLVSLCNWCGTWKGDKVCSGCKRTKYCSHKHQVWVVNMSWVHFRPFLLNEHPLHCFHISQVLHWHSGHKIDCQQLSLSVDSSSSKNGTTSAEIIKG